MGGSRFSGHRQSKGICDRENARNGVYTEFITPIRRTTARNGKQYAKRKGRIPNDSNISIQPHAGVASRTRIDARRISTTRQPPIVCQHNKQGEGEITANIYRKITYYKCVQLGHCIGSCPVKEDEKEKFKEKVSNPEKSCRDSTTSRRSYQACTSTTKRKRATEI